MPQKDVYSKKITSEEEQKNFVLVLKDRLSFFPDEGETFKLIHNGQPRKAKIESYPCSCRGPDQPHSHYFVKSRGLRAGDRITIQRDVKGGGRYFFPVEPRLLPSPDRLANWLNRWFKSIYWAELARSAETSF